MDTLIGWTLVSLALLWLIPDRLVAALIWLDRHNDEADAQAAAYPDEWWLFDDPAFIDRPSEAVQFAATVMATIEELPEVAS